MKRILVPYDFSEPSIQALTFAIHIAKKSNGQVMLLHIVEVPVMHDTMIVPVLDYEMSFFKDLRLKAEKHFTKIGIKFAKEGVKIQSFVELGPIQKTIDRIADDKKADLIVMGTHGVTGFLDSFIGSNTEKVVRFSKVPVIAVHQLARLSKIRNVVFPTTLHQNQATLVRHIKKLQLFFSATLHLLVVNTPGNMKRTADENQLMEAYARHYKLENYTINTKNDFSVENGIVNFSREIKADMIALGTHGRKGLAHLFLGSIAENVVNSIECPVWTYVEKEIHENHRI
jgi:nucleotide-binding universal stress UspA family protein